jgi:hypothetical protein
LRRPGAAFHFPNSDRDDGYGDGEPLDVRDPVPEMDQPPSASSEQFRIVQRTRPDRPC